MRWLRFGWRTTWLAFHVLAGILLTLMFYRRDRHTQQRHHNPFVVAWWHARLLRILGVRVERIGHLPRPPALVVANHISWLDIPIIGATLHTSFLSKDEVRSWPLVGWLASCAGTLFIRRGSGQTRALTEGIAQRLSTDGIITLFPEGTTTDGQDVRPFFSRLFAAAIDTGTEVATVALHYQVAGRHDPRLPFVGEQSLADNLIYLLQQPRIDVRVTVGPQMSVQGKDRKTLAEQARRQIRAAIRPADAARPVAAAQDAASRRA